MGMIRPKPIPLIVRAIAVRMPLAGGKYLYARFRAAIGQNWRGQPSLFGFHRLRPGALALAAAMRPSMPGLPQHPCQEHQGSEQHSDTTGRAVRHGPVPIIPARLLSTLRPEAAGRGRRLTSAGVGVGGPGGGPDTRAGTPRAAACGPVESALDPIPSHPAEPRDPGGLPRVGRPPARRGIRRVGRPGAHRGTRRVGRLGHSRSRPSRDRPPPAPARRVPGPGRQRAAQGVPWRISLFS
jgi:hypothetical protein